jgi:hypothetical protein
MTRPITSAAASVAGLEALDTQPVMPPSEEMALNYPESEFTNLRPGSRLSTVVIDEEIDYAARHRRRRRQRIGAALVAAGFAAATVIPSISAIF